MKNLPPVVTETPVGPDFLQPFQIFTQLVLQHIRSNLEDQNNMMKLLGNEFFVTSMHFYLRELAILDVFLPVEEPVRDLVLTRIGHDCNQFLNLRNHKKQ